MACLSAYYLAGTPRPKPHFVSISLKQKPSQLHYSTTPRSIILPQSTKNWALISQNVTQPTKSRCSVRACSVESDKLPSDVRKRAMEAIDSSGRRVTIDDVVSKAILKLNEAQKALLALAADTNGFLEVSDEGDIFYVFPKHYRLKLAAKSFRIKIGSLLDKGKMPAAFLVRVSFGMSLAATSVFGLFPAILFDSNTNDGRLRRSYDNACQTNEEVDVDLCFKAVSSLCSGRLIENGFSIVFEDCDPNQGIEEKRWNMIGQYIALHGGVVTAEELAPYLDPTEKMDDESYMLPVLLRFDGQPEVDEEGDILYYFASLQRTAPPQRSRAKEYVGRWVVWVIEVEKFLKEKEWEFRKVDSEEVGFMIDLLGFNLLSMIFGIAWVADVSTPFHSYIILPLLLMYGIYVCSFVVIVLFRSFFIRRRNAKIVRSNEAREQRAKALESPDLFLEKKLLSARSMARWISMGKDIILYDKERREWDRRFKERWGGCVP